MNKIILYKSTYYAVNAGVTPKLFINPPPKTIVKVNPNYDPKIDNTYYCTSFNPITEKKIRHYTINFVKRNKRKKFANHQVIDHALPKVRKRYSSDLRSSDPYKKYVALTVALVDQALFRIGSSVPEKKNVRGLTTLQVKHVKIRGNEVHFKYKGKDNFRQHQIITDPLILRLCKELLKGKESNDYFLSYKTLDGGRGRITAELANEYLRKIGMPASIHKFRSYHATRMARDILDEAKPNKKAMSSEKKFVKWFRNQVEPISKALGHATTAATLNHYVDPSVVEHFFKKHKKKMPKTILASITIVKSKTKVVSNPKISQSEKRFEKWISKHKLPNKKPINLKVK